MAKKDKYVVSAPFRDRDNYIHEHKVGDDVSDMAPERLADLLQRNLVTPHIDLGDPEAPEAPEEKKGKKEEKQKAEK